MMEFDDVPDARAVRDAVATLEPPPLPGDTLARIIARRSSGERVPLQTTDIASADARQATILRGTLLAAAALLIAALLSHRSTDSSRNQFALSPPDSACASFSSTQDSSTLRDLLVSTFGVAAACGAEPTPDPPITVDGSRIATGEYTYGGVSITDRVFTSAHKPWTISIARVPWHGAPALLAVREGPLLTGVHTDSLIVAMSDLAPLHFASWYPTQRPVGSLHADFDSSTVTIVMTGRFDTVATFPFPTKPGELPFGWTEALVVPALPLAEGWHGTVQIALPIHPHAYKLLGKPWASMSLRVVARERIRVAAGTFDCWKLQVGALEDASYVWVSADNHLVIRSRTTYRSGDTEFEDRAELQRMISTPP